VKTRGKNESGWVTSEEPCVQCTRRNVQCMVRPEAVARAREWMKARAVGIATDQNAKPKFRIANSTCQRCASSNGNYGPCCFPSVDHLLHLDDHYFDGVKGRQRMAVEESLKRYKNAEKLVKEKKKIVPQFLKTMEVVGQSLKGTEFVEGSSKGLSGIMESEGTVLATLLQRLLEEMKQERAEWKAKEANQKRHQQMVENILFQITGTYPQKDDNCIYESELASEEPGESSEKEEQGPETEAELELGSESDLESGFE